MATVVSLAKAINVGIAVAAVAAAAVATAKACIAHVVRKPCDLSTRVDIGAENEIQERTGKHRWKYPTDKLAGHRSCHICRSNESRLSPPLVKPAAALKPVIKEAIQQALQGERVRCKGGQKEQ